MSKYESKLGKTAFARICDIEELDILVTDNSAPHNTLEEIRRAGVDVIVV